VSPDRNTAVTPLQSWSPSENRQSWTRNPTMISSERGIFSARYGLKSLHKIPVISSRIKFWRGKLSAQRGGWSKDAVDRPWSFVDGHHCAYPSVTVSMDVTVALTIHRPSMDRHHCAHPSVTVSMGVTVAVTIHDHPWMVNGWSQQWWNEP